MSSSRGEPSEASRPSRRTRGARARDAAVSVGQLVASLDDDLVIQILLQLDSVKDVLSFRSVSPNWCRIVSAGNNLFGCTAGSREKLDMRDTHLRGYFRAKILGRSCNRLEVVAAGGGAGQMNWRLLETCLRHMPNITYLNLNHYPDATVKEPALILAALRHTPLLKCLKCPVGYRAGGRPLGKYIVSRKKSASRRPAKNVRFKLPPDGSQATCGELKRLRRN